MTPSPRTIWDHPTVCSSSRLGIALFVGALLWLPTEGGAQTPPAFEQEWRWVDFGPESGLPPGVVQEIIEVDSVMWVRTDSAVAWYDGFQWTVPIPEAGPRPVGPTTSLAPDSSGHVLVVQGGRVYRGSPQSMEPVPLGDLGALYVVKAVPHVRGSILATTRGEQPRLWTIQDGTATEVTNVPPMVQATALTLTRGGRAWLDTEEGLHVYRDGRWVDRLPSDEGSRAAAQVTENEQGFGFIHLATYSPATALLRFQGDGPATPVPGEGGNLPWAGDIAANGFGLVAYETGDVRAWIGGEWLGVQLPPNRAVGVRAIYIATNGDIWFGSARGLHRFRQSTSRYTVMRQPFPDMRNRVNAIAVPREGGLWLGTAGGVLHHIPGGGSRWITEADGVLLRGVTGVVEDGAGRIWVGSGGDFEGLLRWDGARWTHMGPAQGFDVGRVHDVFVTADDAMWIASLGHRDGTIAGLYRWKDGTLARPEDLGLPEERAYAVAEGPDGAIWAVFGSALYRIQGDTIRAWTGTDFESAGVRGARLWDVAVDAAGEAWVALSPDMARGLIRVDRDGMLHLERPSGPQGTRSVWSVTADDDGGIWAGTEAGVVHYHGEVWSRFDESTGLPTLNVWPVVVTGESVLIGTKGGGLVLMSLREENSPPPRVLVRPVTPADRTAEVQFTALAYQGEMQPGAIDTRYRLDGGDWSDWSTARSVTLVNLHVGQHTLEVQARGLFGTLSDPVPAAFTVLPPLILRPAFGIPVGGLLLALLVLGTTHTVRRLRQDRELRLSEQRLRTLLENAPEAIAILDAEAQRFVDANDKALELFGVDREGLGDLNPTTLTPPRLRDVREGAILEELNATRAGATPVVEWSILNSQGQEIPCEIRFAKLPATNRQLIRVSMVDIRDRLTSEAQRAELEEQLRQSQKLEAVGKLSGGIAHDFNNLLTVIRGNLELLVEDYPADSDQAELVGGALEAVQRSTQLSQRLLAIGRRQPLEAKPVDVGELLTSMEDLLRRSLGETVELDLTAPDGIWPAITDSGQLENAILNLAINARDAMVKGGRLSIRVRALPAAEVDGAHFAELAPGDYVAISVTDTGAGMDPEVAARAFDPFFTTKEVGKGSGLGLSMVYGFATQSGGSARIESVRGKGTKVELVLPRAPEAPATGSAKEGRTNTLRGSGQRILVVEDDPGVAKLLMTLLDHLGYAWISAQSGDEARSVLERGDPVDALLVDLVLPGSLNGVEVAVEAKRLRGNIPILYMSGYGEDSLPASVSSQPAPQPLLRKPFDQASLARHLERLFSTEASKEA